MPSTAPWQIDLCANFNRWATSIEFPSRNVYFPYNNQLPSAMTTKEHCNHIRHLIGRGDLATAIEQLQRLLEGSPQLDEAVLQSARYRDIT
ncbi:MAG: hypothetical protein AAFV25_21135 [Bacteroidota bacterium]